MPVLDASAILNGFGFMIDHIAYTVPQVMSEFRDWRSKSLVSAAVHANHLRVYSPLQEHVKKVRDTAKRLGEQLSEADIHVLALALELKETIITDDQGIQNTAKSLGIQFKPVMFREARKRVLKKKCPNCSKQYSGDADWCETCDEKLVTLK
ncbi:MAG: ribonuclease VapC [Candidatus Diapherotrites archaeon]|nr:ribonuclease VapC [Candidatus Diapherotrites archaeon]